MVDDIYHGQGKLQILGEYTYEGSFSKGNKHGQGRIVWEDGSFYEGQFV
jgi:hypothetical protein